MDKVIYRTIEPCSMSRKSFTGWLKRLEVKESKGVPKQTLGNQLIGKYKNKTSLIYC